MNKDFTRLFSPLHAGRLPGLVLSMLLLVLLLLPGKVSAQTEIYRDDFATAKVTVMNNKGQTSITGGILKVTSGAGGEGYDVYAVTNSAIAFEPGYTYTTSVKVRNVTAEGKLQITGATTQAGAASSGDSLSDNKIFNAAQTNILATFTVPSTQTLFVGLHTSSDKNKAGMDLENLVITKTCTPPTVTLAAFNPVCKNSPVIDLSGGLPTGGTYTVDGVQATQFNPATVFVGEHEVIYTYTNENGCSNTAAQTLEVKPLPVATILPEDASTPRTQCMEIGSFTYFIMHSNASEGSTLVWTVVKELTTAQSVQVYYPDPQSPTIIVGGTGTATVRLTATDICGNTDDEIVTLEVISLPDAPRNITLLEESERCGAGVVTLRVSGAAEGDYRWYREDGTLMEGVTGSVYSPNLSKTTGYYVSSWNPASGCESSKILVAGTINPLPSVTLSKLKSECRDLDPNVPQAFTLTGTRTGSGDVNWIVFEKDITIKEVVFSDESSVSPTVYVYGSGNVTLRLTLISDKGCGTYYTDTYLRVNPIAVASGTITIEPENPIPGKEATFSFQSNVIDNNDVNIITWFFTVDGETWKELPEKKAVLTMDAVPADLVGVKVAIRPIDFEPTTCYTNLTDGVYSVEAANIVLPVDIIYLQANKQGSSVVLAWATAQERNNKGFFVQVSADGQKYEDLSFVETKNGNSAVKQVYTFTDRENGKYGTRYYRLKQVDEDGTTAYFGPKAVTFGATGNQVTGYPNPFSSEINLAIEAAQAGSVTITITNALGKQLLLRKVPVQQGTNIEKLLLDAQLPHGIYFIHTQMGDQHNSFKMLK